MVSQRLRSVARAVVGGQVYPNGGRRSPGTESARIAWTNRCYHWAACTVIRTCLALMTSPACGLRLELLGYCLHKYGWATTRMWCSRRRYGYCWLCLACSSVFDLRSCMTGCLQWRSRESLIIINTSSGRVHRVESPVPNGSVALLDVLGSNVLVAASNVNTPSAVILSPCSRNRNATLQIIADNACVRTGVLPGCYQICSVINRQERGLCCCSPSSITPRAYRRPCCGLGIRVHATSAAISPAGPHSGVH